MRLRRRAQQTGAAVRCAYGDGRHGHWFVRPVPGRVVLMAPDGTPTSLAPLDVGRLRGLLRDAAAVAVELADEASKQ